VRARERSLGLLPAAAERGGVHVGVGSSHAGSTSDTRPVCVCVCVRVCESVCAWVVCGCMCV